MTAHDLLEAAKRLSHAERQWLAQELLHPPGEGLGEAEVEAAWGDETRRRLDEMDTGEVELISLDVVLAEMEDLLAMKRPG